jgi:5-methylcytosine-specific restriction endonuclease McrA
MGEIYMTNEKMKQYALEHLKLNKNQMYYQQKKGMVIDALGGCCVECGTMEYLEIHHIKELETKYRPLGARIRDWENGLEQDNLMCLCKTCHDYLTNNPQHKLVSGMERETELINKMEDREGASYLRIKEPERRKK